eukprot:2395539-Pyramimonas_sp.AAC.1
MALGSFGNPERGYLLQDPGGQWYKIPVNNRGPELRLDDLTLIPPPRSCTSSAPRRRQRKRSSARGNGICWRCKTTEQSITAEELRPHIGTCPKRPH